LESSVEKKQAAHQLRQQIRDLQEELASAEKEYEKKRYPTPKSSDSRFCKDPPFHL
jgi:hypothetical protein